MSLAISIYSGMNAIEKIQSILAERQIKAADLSRQTGLSESRISKWFGGTGTPNVYDAFRIARALEVPLEWLADLDAQDQPPPLRLTEDEKTVLRLTRELGADEAIRRLLSVKEKPRFVDGEESRRRTNG